MKKTLEHIGASGLAAPQVLVNKRIVVYRVNSNRIPKNGKFKKIPWTVMINPTIKPLLKTKRILGKMPFYSRIAWKSSSI